MTRRHRIARRGMLLEAGYNSRGKQRGGLAWVLAPFEQKRRREPFNTNPTLAGYLTGWLAREDADSEPPPIDTLAAALGAIGDRIVYGLLRPLAVVLSLLASAAGAIPAAVVLILVYNPAELVLRWRSVGRGLSGRTATQTDLGGRGLPRLSALLARLGALATGALAGFWAVSLLQSRQIGDAAAGLGAILLGWFVIRSGRLGAWTVPITALGFGLVWSGWKLFR